MLPNYGNNIITQEASYAAPDYVFVMNPDGSRYVPSIPKTNLTMPKTDTFKKSDTTRNIILAAGAAATVAALIFGIKKFGSKILNKFKKAPTKTPPTP